MNIAPVIIQPRLAVLEEPCVTLAGAEGASNVVGTGSKAISELLTELLNDESDLYAITREWRYDTAGRQFIRLHALLDEQFSEIGVRLTRLAARSRDLASWNSPSDGDRTRRPRTPIGNDTLQAHMIRELLRLHDALITRLKCACTAVSGQFHDRQTTDLLASLTANHEKDAFMLRALLWEAENVTP
jgi:starvation-inducible DNA-binding protein